MKKIVVFTLILALFAAFSLNAFAESEKKLVVDDADLLTDAEEQELQSVFAEIGDKWDYDIVVFTTDEIGVYSAHVYAEQFFDNNGYGRGENADGAIILVSMEERDWGVFATDLSNDGARELGESVQSYLSSGDYFDAFKQFAKEVDKNHSFPWVKNLLIAFVVAFVIAFITVSVMKGKLKSVHSAVFAREYVREGSFKLSQSRDLYLYSTVSRVAKPKNNSNGGVSGGSRGGGASGKF